MTTPARIWLTIILLTDMQTVCSFGFHKNTLIYSLFLGARVGAWFVSMFVFRSEVVHVLCRLGIQGHVVTLVVHLNYLCCSLSSVKLTRHIPSRKQHYHRN